ncbi:proline dehydrogenase family protein [Aeoliella mucimassa]|uniref:L-glutamate gamma-semialdehyde dehydrogenase n=1 Tax=Aeoliella mucimassa TaxID=2527972 RepID=A0A518AV08_9BACT|nr:proline dehydrogenase family protein [Aeoliella mucimassa]QDU58553.1 Bifunctional protein PutA [Aeoliella mucimassa]
MLTTPQVQSISEQLAQLLSTVSSGASGGSLVEQAIALARELQKRSHDLQTPAERRQQVELDRMIQSPHDKATLTQMTDQTFRSREAQRSADQFIHILDVQGIPRFFSPLDRTLLRGFQSFGAYLPGVAMPFVKEKMQQETANVILPAEEELLSSHLKRRRTEGVRMNVNHLGEALLGERDAKRRLEKYLAVLQRPEIEVISVKISTIYSQISALARKHTVDELCDRIELLFRAASRGKFVRDDGREVSKFVYLDMEEYRDMHLTADAFMKTLDRPGLEQVRAGIALQAYVPDSFLVLQSLLEWARKRVAAGGSPITIRLVKGANMEMERVEASLEGWPQAPYKIKIDSDANYVRMLHEALLPENRDAVQIGIASHNLFTLAYGVIAAHQSGMLNQVQFEMLEGMANHQRRALFELVQNLLLYAPAAHQDDFISAIGYLVRRLDENTGPDNFLRHAFNVQVGSDEWNRLEQQFRDSFSNLETVGSQPRRTQDRRQQGGATPQSPQEPFQNEPNTDWALTQHSEWAESIIAKWQPRHSDQARDVPLVVGGEEIYDGRDLVDTIDPSRPELVVGRFRAANSDDAERAIQTAVDDNDGWRRRSPVERTATLYRAADLMAERRGDLLGVMMAEGGKLFTESDPEVSEAIDFCRYYARTAQYYYEMPDLNPKGKGVVVVVSPWNFPLAIPCGGIVAALAAGNTVILKPASDTALIAYEMCRCLWDAGVPKTALQLVASNRRDVSQQMVTHPAANVVVLTGGTETAAHLLKTKPSLHLLAETGGKNATIVTAMADRDLAVKNVVYSAFGHSGQKCSATSLLVLEDEVYHDKGFRDVLCDAVESLRVGSAWKLATRVGPLIRPPRGALEQGLKELEPGESWAVMPEVGVDDNPHLVSPGVKWNVTAGSMTHCTEFFGPLLGVMCVRTLNEAIEVVNATGFGLTSGLESLDDREYEIWRDGIRAGNLYVNRSTTGAIVQRQPFGGMGKSNVGPGIKAGGPNYVAQLMDFAANPLQPDEAESNDPQNSSIARELVYGFDADGELGLDAAIASYEKWAAEEFHQQHDDVRLLGEDNFRRYLPVELVRLRVHADDTPRELLLRVAAAIIAGARVVVSAPPLDPQTTIAQVIAQLDQVTDEWGAVIEFVEETDEQLVTAIGENMAGRIRYANGSRVPEVIRQATAAVLDFVADTPVSSHGRVELLWYLREQSVTNRYHRYGNLGFRAEEERDEPS